MLIGYVRVSTTQLGQSLDTQRESLIDAGCDPNHIYIDRISGTKWQRPRLDDAIKHMRPNDTLVVTRLDRLGRSMVETVTTIADLADCLFNVKVLEPDLDTSRAADRVVVDVISSLSEWERTLLAKRTREGVSFARSQGRIAGPKPKLTSEQAQQAKKLIDGGDTVVAVARRFNVSRATIYRAVRKLSEEK